MIKSFFQYIITEGEGHMKTRLGNGYSGSVYDIGNGMVKKTLRLMTNNHNTYYARKREREVIDKWSKIKEGQMKTIPCIYDWDGDSYIMEKCGPCKEAKWIETFAILVDFNPDPSSWDPKVIENYKSKHPNTSNWVLNWMGLFWKDASNIMEGIKSWHADLNATNIGKTKNNEIVAFDWYNPWS